MTTDALRPTFKAMPVTLPSAALRFMSEQERTRLLDAAFAEAPDALASYLAVLDARLRVFERRYELPSAELRRALERGTLRDTADVSDWLFWAELRGHLAGQARA